MVSEKAKGKQRAVEPEAQLEAGEVPSRALIIRFTEGIPDLTVSVGEQEAVRDVKSKIRDARPQLKDRRLRLILAGQLLADTTSLYSRLASLEVRQRRAARDPYTEGETEQATGTTWLHCSVGPSITEGEEEESKLQTAQLKPLRGFDRLASAGFSEQDIANIRLQFHAHSAGDYIDQEFEDEDDFDEHARVLEEQWIDSFDGGANSSLSQSSSQTSSTILNGIVIGFFFPLIPFFFFSSQKPAVFWEDGREHEVMGSIIFPRRVQMGIVIGFLLNGIFGLWTYLLTSS
ncbi:DUF2407 C-terminal domain-containing protein [Amylocystis lapponica]|nr:DUF2407 C-terminal domain-containing protein [Amylocystis lapponica]